MELNLEKSKAEAAKILVLQNMVLDLDAEYLELGLEAMKRNHSKKDAMFILNPRPLMHRVDQEIEAAKIKQLELYIGLAKNAKELIRCGAAVIAAADKENQLMELFK